MTQNNRFNEFKNRQEGGGAKFQVHRQQEQHLSFLFAVASSGTNSHEHRNAFISGFSPIPVQGVIDGDCIKVRVKIGINT